jgi:hypothetical protein
MKKLITWIGFAFLTVALLWVFVTVPVREILITRVLIHKRMSSKSVEAFLGKPDSSIGVGRMQRGQLCRWCTQKGTVSVVYWDQTVDQVCFVRE